MFVGRGDYVAYDEAWYLLLGRNVMAGDGYTLSGLQHVALSPLYPLLAGALGSIMGNPIWAGRIVSAVAAGLLVIPCWSIFRRLAGRSTALLACALVAVMPSLAPFVVAWWVGWDLWVGAEPVLHLFLYSGIALFLRARARGHVGDWALAGTAFALAYLARPEAVVVFGLLGLGAAAVAVIRRSSRAAVGVAVFGLVFGLVVAPYWIYLHSTLGRWALTGRGVEVTLRTDAPAGQARPRAAARIERMLWLDDEAPYMHTLYALDSSGTRLASAYWGVASANTGPETERMVDDRTRTEAPSGRAAANQVVPGGPMPSTGPAAPPAVPESPAAPNVFVLYGWTLVILVPWFLWPLIVPGLLAPRRSHWSAELPVLGPLVATSLLVAGLVAVDPRTQLFIVPILAFYAARGIRLLGLAWDRRLRPPQIRRRFIGAVLSAIAVVLLLATDARRLYLSVSVGSPHHILGTGKRRVGEVLQRIVPEGEPVMSWAPAVAVHARRDWRVLPFASFPEIIRYAAAVRCRYIVLSVYNPSPLEVEKMPRDYLIVRFTPEAAGAERWTIEVTETGDNYAVAWLRPAGA